MQPRRIALQFTALCLLVSFCSKINILDHGIVWITLRISPPKAPSPLPPLHYILFLTAPSTGLFRANLQASEIRHQDIQAPLAAAISLLAISPSTKNEMRPDHNTGNYMPYYMPTVYKTICVCNYKGSRTHDLPHGSPMLNRLSHRCAVPLSCHQTKRKI